MNTKELIAFLQKAKIKTYASSGEGGETVLEDGSKEFVFIENTLKYRDRYFGFDQFIGEEVVYINNQVVWGMNYCGGVILSKVSQKQVYAFLKEALKKIPASKPFRGPIKFRTESLSYYNKIEGNLKLFQGTETIFYKRQKIYQLTYHGGTIK